MAKPIKAFESKQYWGSSGESAYGRSGASGSGVGADRDVVTYGQPVSRYGVTPAASTNPASLFEPFTITKNQKGLDAVNGLLDSFGTEAGQFADFNKLLKDATDKLSTGQSNVNAAYGRYAGELNIDDFAKTMRGLDAKRYGLTEGYAGDVSGISGRYDDLLGNYRKDLTAAQDEVMAGANRYGAEVIDPSIAAALEEVSRSNKMFSQGRDTGNSSGGQGWLVKAATNASLPYRNMGWQEQQRARQGYLPVVSDIASRYQNKITGFDTPLTEAIYGRRLADTEQSRATEVQLKQLAMSVAGMNYEAAVQQLTRQGMSVEQAAKMYQMGQQLKAGQISNLSNTLGMLPQVQWQNLNYTPGAQAMSPNYGNPTVYRNDAMPSRYGNSTATATAAAPASAPASRYPSAPAPTGSYWTDSYNRGRTPEEEAFFKQSQLLYQ